jgi:hypothetical protein
MAWQGTRLGGQPDAASDSPGLGWEGVRQRERDH